MNGYIIITLIQHDALMLQNCLNGVSRKVYVMDDYLKRAWAEINLDNLIYNLNELKQRVNGNCTQIVGVVKANAYGHDDKNISLCMEAEGISFFAVSNIKEAINLRNYGIKGEILVLGYTPPTYAQELFRYDIIQAVVSEEYAKELSESAKKSGVVVKVHVGVDTGMGRIGLIAKGEDSCNKSAETIREIADLPNISVDGLFTHFAVADSLQSDDSDYTNKQITCFFRVCDLVRKMGISIRHTHCLNSAGGLIHYDPRSTLVRFGIVLYGLLPDRGLALPITVKPVLSLKSVVSCIRKLTAGSYISYGRTYITDCDRLIATVPIGYADGYVRSLSGKAHVIVSGKKAPIVGRICMDQLMVDVTDIADVSEGSVVTLIGSDGENSVTADELAGLCGTIGYEIVCGISKRVPRIIYKDDKIIDVVEYY